MLFPTAEASTKGDPSTPVAIICAPAKAIIQRRRAFFSVLAGCNNAFQLEEPDHRIIAFAITESIYDGYDLAAMLSAQNPGILGLKAEAMLLLTGGFINASIGTPELDGFSSLPLPAACLFVYPEHTLVPKQQQAFLNTLLKQHPEVKQIILLTTCPVILSDLLSERIQKIKITKNPYAHQCRTAGTSRRRPALFLLPAGLRAGPSPAEGFFYTPTYSTQWRQFS